MAHFKRSWGVIYGIGSALLFQVVGCALANSDSQRATHHGSEALIEPPSLLKDLNALVEQLDALEQAEIPENVGQQLFSMLHHTGDKADWTQAQWFAAVQAASDKTAVVNEWLSARLGTAKETSQPCAEATFGEVGSLPYNLLTQTETEAWQQFAQEISEKSLALAQQLGRLSRNEETSLAFSQFAEDMLCFHGAFHAATAFNYVMRTLWVDAGSPQPGYPSLDFAAWLSSYRAIDLFENFIETRPVPRQPSTRLFQGLVEQTANISFRALNVFDTCDEFAQLVAAQGLHVNVFFSTFRNQTSQPDLGEYPKLVAYQSLSVCLAALPDDEALTIATHAANAQLLREQKDLLFHSAEAMADKLYELRNALLARFVLYSTTSAASDTASNTNSGWDVLVLAVTQRIARLRAIQAKILGPTCATTF